MKTRIYATPAVKGLNNRAQTTAGYLRSFLRIYGSAVMIKKKPLQQINMDRYVSIFNDDATLKMHGSIDHML